MGSQIAAQSNKDTDKDKGKSIFRHKQMCELQQMHIKYQLSGLEELMLFMGTHTYKNIASLNLQSCEIGPIGCKLITNAKWINLRNINISQNKIGNEGCLYLSKTQWKQLENINLIGNGIRDQACSYLSKANWKQIKSIQLNIKNGKQRRRNKVSQTGINTLDISLIKDKQLKRSDKYAYYSQEIEEQNLL